MNSMTENKVPQALRVLRYFTVAQAAKAMGVHYITALRRINALRAQKKLYRHSYANDLLGRAQIPVYKVGKGVDVDPKPVPGAVRSKLYRQRLKEQK